MVEAGFDMDPTHRYFEAEQHILFVDDDPDFLKSLEFFLPQKVKSEIEGVWYRFLFMNDPFQALTALKDMHAGRETVAMIISDQKMPQMKGTQFLDEAKKIFPESIRVLLTGYAGQESAIEAINNNLLDKYLTKPIENENTFILDVQHLLQRFQMKRTIQEQDKMIHDLYAFSNVLNGIEDFSRTLDYIAAFTRETLNCERISILLIEENTLRIKASRGLTDQVVRDTEIPVGERVSGKVFQSKEAVLAKSIEEIPYVAGSASAQAQSFISVPILYAGLVSGDQPLGVINVTEKMGHDPFTEIDLEKMTYIANTASIAIHNQLNRARLRNAYLETAAKAAALEYQMTHDVLTDLANRTMLRDRIQRSTHGEAGSSPPLALMVMDLDRFKEYNDTLGHHNGDILLKEVAVRLLDLLHPVECLARLGGDEFAVLLRDVNQEEALRAASGIQKIFEAPFIIEEFTIHLGASIGLALSPIHGTIPNLLLQRAEVAMYQAKKGGGGFSLYDPDQDPYTTRRLMILGALREAIEKGGLILHYQPKVDLRTGRLVGVEALVRWHHPKFGALPPDQFIPIAEQSGLIKPLTLWVLNEALRQSRAWQEEGWEIPVAVNLSALNLQDPRLPDHVAGFLKAWDISHQFLALELTESTVMENPPVAIEVLKRLEGMGIRIAIDDFGTGHSSLAYLKRLPVREIKLDKSFVKNMEKDRQDVQIVESTVTLGHNLGLTVVAEGVEDQETYDRLAGIGCDVAQGYFLSRPIPGKEFLDWCKQNQLRKLESTVGQGSEGSQ